MVIDYVIDACRKTNGVDEFVIVASANYVEFCEKRSNIPTVEVGGHSSGVGIGRYKIYS